MSETITEEKRTFTITDDLGIVHKVKGKVIKTDHGVTDEDGNPKVSIEVKVPPVNLIAKPGEVT